MEGKTFATQSFFTNHLKLKIVNKTTYRTPLANTANYVHISRRPL